MHPRRLHAASTPFLHFVTLALCYALLVTPLAALAATTTPPPALAQNSNAKNKQPKRGRRAGELIVRFREGTSEEVKRQVLASRGGNNDIGEGGGGSKRRLRGSTRLEKLKFSDGQNIEAIAAELRFNPAVELVEPNFLISPDETTPDDSRFAEQWGLRNTGSTQGSQVGSDIGATGAWDTTVGATATIIAVLDSGVDFTHPELAANQWTNPAEQQNNQDDDGNGLLDDVSGWDFVTNSGAIKDEQGHGTSIAGIIAARGNNQTGIAGVMWRASLMSLRVLDRNGTGDVAAAVEAIEYAVANGAKVINASWGTDEESIILREAIERAAARDVIVICSAGNSSRDITAEPYYPSSFNLPNVISVAASDSSDLLSGVSNWGAESVTLAAPGVNILTTRMGGGYRTVSGTSAATAVVSGVAGLLRTQRPRLRAGRTKDAIVENVRAASELAGKVSANGVVYATTAINALANMSADDDLPEDAEDGDGGDDNNGGNGSGGTAGGGSGGGGTNTIESAMNLPNLEEAKRLRPSAPKAQVLIQADLRECEPSDPDCEGGTYNEPPVANAGGPYTAIPGQAKLFDGSASDDTDGFITSYSWNFGDGTTGTGATPSHIYSAGGTYTVTLTVRDNKLATDSISTSVTVVAQTNNAAFLRQSVPTAMITGRSYNVSIRMKNTGTTVWRTTDNYKLGWQNPQDNTTWRPTRVELPEAVAPGAETILTFAVTSPSAPGTYNHRLRMVRIGFEWFGDYTTNIAVNVSSPATGSSSYNGIMLPEIEIGS